MNYRCCITIDFNTVRRATNRTTEELCIHYCINHCHHSEAYRLKYTKIHPGRPECCFNVMKMVRRSKIFHFLNVLISENYCICVLFSAASRVIPEGTAGAARITPVISAHPVSNLRCHVQRGDHQRTILKNGQISRYTSIRKVYIIIKSKLFTLRITAWLPR